MRAAFSNPCSRPNKQLHGDRGMSEWGAHLHGVTSGSELSAPQQEGKTVNSAGQWLRDAERTLAAQPGLEFPGEPTAHLSGVYCSLSFL